MSQETRGATVPVGNSNSYNAQQSSSDPIDDERVEIINQASRDSSANYCFIHKIPLLIRIIWFIEINLLLELLKLY